MDSLHDLKIGDRSSLDGACVCIGVFDGFHLGHKALVDACIKDASDRGARSVILTFDKDPDEIFSESLEKIMRNSQRIDYLESVGADDVLAIDFNENMADTSPLDFLDGFFGENLPASIHVGADFKFGRGGSGDTGFLREWCDDRSVDLFVQEILLIDEAPVKSTRIRDLLSKGDISSANMLLGHPYTVCGPVAHGRGEGSEFGFATANVGGNCLLEDGVYAGYAFVCGKRHKAAISVGIPPTFKDVSKDSLEVHILDYSGDLYGKELCVSFVERIRPMIKFDSTEELVSQVRSDISFVRENL